MSRADREGLPAVLYLHIPFCAARCRYCDFNAYAGLEALFEPYVTALCKEIRGAGEAYGSPTIRTIFIGGGTPTVLPIPLLGRLLDACNAAFAVECTAEITCEANPGTADQATFAALHTAGVNRLSLGVQSFDDEELRWLGRIHTASEAELAFIHARAAGFANINLDLIFGLAVNYEEPARKWRETLQRAVILGPEHLSLYGLTAEPSTPLGRQVARGLAPPPDDDMSADLYLLACDFLASHDYVHYEISNWAAMPNGHHVSRQAPHAGDLLSAASKPRQPAGAQPTMRDPQPAIGNQCAHNLVYWRRQPYLGFGAGAHSFDGARRWWNARTVPHYIERVEGGRAPKAGGERIGVRLAMAESMMLGLRLLEEGVPGERFRAQFGIEVEEAFGSEIKDLVARGLIERLPDRVRLTPAGVLLANRVFAEFMPS